MVDMMQVESGQDNVEVSHLIMVIHQYNCMFLSKACQGLKEKKFLSCCIFRDKKRALWKWFPPKLWKASFFMFTSFEIINSLPCHNNKRQTIHSTSQPKKEAENRNVSNQNQVFQVLTETTPTFYVTGISYVPFAEYIFFWHYNAAHGTRTCIKRKKITYGKFFDFRAEKCI